MTGIWLFWALLPWRNVYTVTTWDDCHRAPYSKLYSRRRDAVRAYRRQVARAVTDDCARCRSTAVVELHHLVTPWRPGCALRELDRGTWQIDWPRRLMASYRGAEELSEAVNRALGRAVSGVHDG